MAGLTKAVGRKKPASEPFIKKHTNYIRIFYVAIKFKCTLSSLPILQYNRETDVTDRKIYQIAYP